jgi:N utilization substance protein A
LSEAVNPVRRRRVGSSRDEEANVNRDFVTALLQLNAEKQVPREQLIRTVEDAIQSAYRRTEGNEDVQVRIDGETGRIRTFRARQVVDEVADPLTELTREEARAHDPNAQVGDLVETEELDPEAFGRIHAQTAKQVVLQRLREAERDVAYDQFASREGELVTGTVNRVEPRAIILDLTGQGGIARAEAVLATTEQSSLEHYRIGQPVKAFVLEVRRGLRGPQLFVSRAHKNFLRRLFELEVPEIHSGTVEIKAIAREAGSRSKVAVASRQDGLDPVGATVGQRGARVQAVVAELAGEKIDVIPWNDDPAVFVANALSPAQVLDVSIDEEHRIASVTVPERMLSLAIGREGQNARLAAKLSGWRIDIRSDVSVAEAKAAAAAEGATPAPAAEAVEPASVEEAAAGSAAGADAPTTKAKPKTSRAKAAAVEAAPDMNAGAGTTAAGAVAAQAPVAEPATPTKPRASRAKKAAPVETVDDAVTADVKPKAARKKKTEPAAEVSS